MPPASKSILKFLSEKRILILGFGKEGISTYNYLIKRLPASRIGIADKDEGLLSRIDFRIDSRCEIVLGKNYLDVLTGFDVVIKSPGIPFGLIESKIEHRKITSQTELFLKCFAPRTIGITGTKGKSTTSSLIKHILSSHHHEVLLVGNIGKPPFDHIDQIREDTFIVFELSSHQLETIHVSPGIAVILNIYEEHLDHYENYERYQSAKLNITRFQSENDWLILNRDNEILWKQFCGLNLTRKQMLFSHGRLGGNGCFAGLKAKVICNFQQSISEFDFSHRQYLPGDHNLMNIMASVCVAKVMGVPDDLIARSVLEFKGLPHRMEFIGKFGEILFYNDSISTIPQATILAVKSLGNVNTLILGGKDRGIDYTPLADFLPVSEVRNVIFTGEAGKRIFESVKNRKPENQQYFVISDFREIQEIIKTFTTPGSICLLSPAASSYDMFKNFEERGEVFKKIAESL